LIKIRKIYRLAFWGLITLIAVSVASALTISNSVPLSRHVDKSAILDSNLLKPAECSGLNLTAIFVCPVSGGNCTGTNTSELIIGSVFTDNINGNDGDDCILGGGGNDTINGGVGTNVCIGGPGSDDFDNTCTIQIQ
jgi:hypothetical protein